MESESEPTAVGMPWLSEGVQEADAVSTDDPGETTIEETVVRLAAVTIFTRMVAEAQSEAGGGGSGGGGTTSAPATAPSPKRRVSPLGAVAGAALVLALAALLTGISARGSAGSAGEPSRQEPDSALTIAQITDPHIFEEPRSGRNWEAGEQENRRAFAGALGYIGSLPLRGQRMPDALVITGDLGLDESFRGGNRPTPLTEDEQVDVVARLLGASPVKKIFVVVGNNDVKDENPAALATFDAFLQKVSARVGGGVTVQDLTACYAGQPDSACVADLPHRVRLIGFTSATFKNSPPDPAAPGASSTADTTKPGAPPATPTTPTAPADSAGARQHAASAPTVSAPARRTVVTGPERPAKYDVAARRLVAADRRDTDSAAVAHLRALVEGAAGRFAVILTHEPDIDDPFARTVIATYQRSQPKDTALDPSVWNVDSTIRKTWNGIVGRPNVVAVMSGHLHSANPDDYAQPYLGTRTAGRADFSRLFIGPPLAVKNQEDAYPQARGISLFRIVGDTVTRQILWRDKFTGAFVPTGGAAVGSGETRGAAAGEVDGTDKAMIALIALAAGIAGAFAAFAQGLPRWRRGASNPHDSTRDRYWWLENTRFLPAMLFVLGGLVLCLLLFCRTWDDRALVAFWYTPFAILGLVLGGLLLRLKWMEGSSPPHSGIPAGKSPSD